MAPRVKFQKEEIIAAALNVVRTKGIEALTAREVGAQLQVSSRPIFTWFDSMEDLKKEVSRMAMEKYRICITEGLKEPIPFLGVWHRYIRFAREEPMLYRLLFLSRADETIGGAAEAMRFSQDLVRDSVMKIYQMTPLQADSYFRNIWLAAFSYAAMIVNGDCPYTDEEIFAVGTELSIAVCKAYKEIPGLAEGSYDRDAIFRKLVIE